MRTDAFAAGVEAVVAAERVAELEADVATLRRALGEILAAFRVDSGLSSWHRAMAMDRAEASARAALAATEPEPGEGGGG